MDTTIYTSSSPLIHNLPVTNSTPLTTTNFNKIAGLLSASLYSYPIPSAIREILQNALDANKASNATDKVKIILPCSDSPFISIQDFGFGISPEFFSQFYCDLGYSTKSLDNNYTGGFGIGKLAPLSFSSQLFINSVCDNQEHTYLITKENDQFSFNHLSSSPSSSPSGTTIKFPCPPSKHREVHHAVLYFCEFIPSLVEVYEQYTDGNLRKNTALSEHLEYFQSSKIEDPVELSFNYFLPRNAGGVNFSLGSKSSTPVPILLSFLIGDIAYSLSTSLENQLFSYYKETSKNENNKIRIERYERDNNTLELYPFFSNCINSSEHLPNFNLTVKLLSNNFRNIYSSDYQPSLKIEENLEYHNIVIQLPPNAVTLTSSREFIQDTPQNNSFLLNVIYAVLSKIVYIENSLPREYEHFIQQGDLAQFLYEMIDPTFLEEKLPVSCYLTSTEDYTNTKGFLYKNTVYPKVDPRIKNSYHIGEYCPTQTSYSLLKVPFDSKLFRTKQFINCYITEIFCYSAKTDVELSLLDCSREGSFVKDFRFKSFYQRTEYNTKRTNKRGSDNTGLFIQCSSSSFISFCKYLESVKVLTKCSKLNDRYYCSKIKHNEVNHLEFTYFLSFFSHTRKGYIVYYEYETSSDLNVKNLVSRLQKQYPDSVDWDILFVPYYSDRNRTTDRTLTMSYNFVTEEFIYPEKFHEGLYELYSSSDLTRFLNYFRSSLIILNYDLEEETVKEIPKLRRAKVEKSSLQIAATAIKSGGFYTLDPTKSKSLNISTEPPKTTICSPFKYCNTYDVSVPTTTLPEAPPGTVNIIYSTSKDCGNYNYNIDNVIPPNLDFNRVYFASNSVKALLLNCPSWITIEEYCFQQYKFYLEEYKEVFELFGYCFPQFLVGRCTTHLYDFSSIEPFVRTFVHQIFSLVDFLKPNVKTKLLKLLKEDWKVIHWMDELYHTPICFKGNKKDSYIYEHYNYHKLNPTFQFKLPNHSDSDTELKRVRICETPSDNGLFTTWVSSNETQDKFFKELFSRYPLLQSVMLNLISCRKKTPFDSPSLDHPIFRYLDHENSKNCN